MDHYGIGTALKTSLDVYFLNARGTGRTTNLLCSLKSGDRVIFATSVDADRFRRMCYDRNLQVECVVVKPKELQKLHNMPESQGKTLFDHNFIENFYRDSISHSIEFIDDMEQKLSRSKPVQKGIRE